MKGPTNRETLEKWGLSEDQIQARWLIENFVNTATDLANNQLKDKDVKWLENLFRKELDNIWPERYREPTKDTTVHDEIINLRQWLCNISLDPIDRLISAEGGIKHLSKDERDEAHLKFAKEHEYNVIDLDQLPGGKRSWGEYHTETSEEKIRRIVHEEVTSIFKTILEALNGR